MKLLAAQWPVLFRAALYFIIGFLAPFSDQISSSLKLGTWPTAPATTLGCLYGLMAGLTALRAFYDGTAERHANAGGRSSGDTTYLTKNG